MPENSELVVNPATGEVLEHLDQQPPETLAEALDILHAQLAEAKRMADAISAEFRRRLKARGARLVVFGNWEVEASIRRESVWDAEELETAMERLVEDGTIRAADATGVIVREPVVSRSKAKALLGRLDGEAREQVAAACEWREKPGPVTVARSVQLAPASGLSPALEPVPSAPPVGRDGHPSDIDPEELFRQ